MRGKYVKRMTAILPLAALIGGLGWTIYAPVRQDRLNRALIAAIKNNDTEKTLAMLTEGADPNARDDLPQHLSLWQLFLNRLQGKRPAPSAAPTALLVACALGRDQDIRVKPAPDNEPMVQALLERGAKVEAIDRDGKTPLFWAALLHKWQVCHLLVERGANVNATDITGWTPLMLAVDDPAMTESLLSKGANVNTRAYYGLTALMEAILSNTAKHADQVRSVRILLQHGAEVNIKTKGGVTPLQFAIGKGNPTIIQMLKQAGAKE